VPQDLLDAFFAREHRTIVEGFFDAKFGEPDLGHKRRAVARQHEFLVIALLGLILTRVDDALGELVCSLPAPDNPVRSVPEMVLARFESVDGDPLNEALFAAESTAVAAALEKGSEPIVELLLRH
jgi:TetR/AcrR family transcriptional regulator